jgi:hypothetical protein
MAVTAVSDGPTQTLCAEHRVHAEYLGACRLHAHRRVPTAPANSNLTYREPLHLAGQVMCMNKGSLDGVWELGQDCQRMRCLRGLLHVGVRQQAEAETETPSFAGLCTARKAATCLCLHDVLRHNAARFEEAVQE